MKIAIVTSSFPLSPDDPAAAAGLFVRDFAIQLAALGPEVHVMTQDKGNGCLSPPSELEVHCYDWGGGTKALSQLKLFKPIDLLNARKLIKNAQTKLFDLHKKHGFDHVLAMWAVPSGLTARQLFDRHNVPYSVWCLGSDIWTYGKIPILKNIVGNVIKKARYRFADGIKLSLDAKQLSGYDVEFLPSSRNLPVNEFEAQEMTGESPRFLFVGRYAKVKGIDILLDSFAKFRTTHKGSLYLLGGGKLKNSITAQVNQLDLNDSVSIGDFANAETVVRFGKACDAFVIPSRNESIPVVLSDAAQLGKPVIVSDVGDMGKIVRETNSGLVVDAGDRQQLASAMAQITEQGFQNFDLGIRRLANRFDVKTTASQFLHRIQNCGKQPPRPDIMISEVNE